MPLPFDDSAQRQDLAEPSASAHAKLREHPGGHAMQTSDKKGKQMDEQLWRRMRERGLDPGHHSEAWKGCEDLLAALDSIGRTGSSVVVKIDGGRLGADVYTVVLSGGLLGEEFFRKDGSQLDELLREAITFFLSHTSTSTAGC